MTNYFSIIIPALNEELTIIETLKSIVSGVAHQEKYYEIIIIDSKSCDGTVKIANNYLKSKKVPYYIIELNKTAYPGKARNIGVEKAKYEQLIFIDCGVTIPKIFFTECQEQIKINDAIWFQSSFIFNSYREKGFVRPYFVKREKARYIRHCAMKKKVFISCGYFREDLRAAEDWLFYRQIEKNNLTEYFSKNTGYYQGYPKSLIEFYKKWKMYFKHSVYAKIYYKNLLISLIQLLFIILVSICTSFIINSSILSIVLVLLIYLVVRGFYSFYKSKLPPTSLLDMIYTIITSGVIEISRIIGVLKGVFTSGK